MNNIVSQKKESYSSYFWIFFISVSHIFFYLIFCIILNFKLNYSWWWTIRLIGIILLPIFFKKDLENIEYIINENIILCILLSFPTTLACLYLNNLTVLYILPREFYLILVLFILTIKFQSSPSMHIYIPIMFVFFTFPLFLYYLCLDILHYSFPQLLLVSPLGLIFAPNNANMIYSWGTLVVFVCLKFAKII